MASKGVEQECGESLLALLVDKYTDSHKKLKGAMLRRSQGVRAQVWGEGNIPPLVNKKLPFSSDTLEFLIFSYRKIVFSVFLNQ